MSTMAGGDPDWWKKTVSFMALSIGRITYIVVLVFTRLPLGDLSNLPKVV